MIKTIVTGEAEQALVNALRQVVEGQTPTADDPNTFTRSELIEVFGYGMNKTQRIIRELVSSGVLAPEKVFRTMPHGHIQQIHGYRFSEME